MNKDQLLVYNRKRWANRTPERIALDKEWHRTWSRANRERIKANKDMEQSLACSKKQQANLRSLVMSKLGGVCVRCGFSDARALQVDHPNGGGSSHIKSTPWHRRYREIINNPNGFQLLCANCNWIKRSERSEYRRRKT